MKRSTSRMLTTHTGSRPRSPELQELRRRREDRQSFDEASFHVSVRDAVGDILDRQQNAGIDVVEANIDWAKLASIAEGARLATRELWQRPE